MDNLKMIKALRYSGMKYTKDEKFCDYLDINITYPFRESMKNDMKKCCPELKKILQSESPYFGYWERDVSQWLTEYNKLSEKTLKKIPKHEMEFFNKAIKYHKEQNKVNLNLRKIKRFKHKVKRSTAELLYWGLHNETPKKKKIDVEFFVGTTGRFYIKEDRKWGSRTRLRFAYQYYTYNMQAFFIQRLFRKEMKPLINEVRKVKKEQEKIVEDISTRYKEDCAKYLVFSKL